MTSHVTEAQAAVLDGRDPLVAVPESVDAATGKATPAALVPATDPAFVKHFRVEAVWAKLHDDAAEAFNGDASQFFGNEGQAKALHKALDTAPLEASCADLLAIGRAAIDKVKPKPKQAAQGQTAAPSQPPSAAVAEPEHKP